ncbi:MAG: PAS domain-containing sensor histidine kinase [Promethearchaeota archaeon]|nr:MAG: PAS domain-containing sensor histidine kinase [Candidatus Lokiarchaeota archaeon]
MEHLKRQLSKENNLMQILFEENPYMINLLDKEGKFLYANRKFLKRIGLSFENIREKTIFDLFNFQQPEKIRKARRKLKNGETIKNLKIELNTKNKENRFFKIYAFPLGEKHNYSSFLIVVTDISRREKVKKQLKELSDITLNSADSIIKTNKQFEITYMNPAAEELYGWKLEDARGKTPAIFNAAPNVETFQNKIYKTVNSGQIYKGTYLNKRKDGTLFYCEMKISPLFDEKGDIYAFTSSQRDVTPRIQAEKHLKEALAKSDFYRDLLAHDMGNILNNIQSSIQLLELLDSNQEMSKEKKDAMNIIKKQVKRGSSLISNVRKLSDINGIELPLKTIEIKGFITSAFKDICSRFQEREVEVRRNIPKDAIKVEAGDLLLDVFENILINGCIHNDSKKIELEINVSKIRKNEERYIQVEFKDNGIGIIDENKESIFQRSIKRGKSKGGMGLGLSLVKSIIEQYNGKIWVENRIEGDYTQGSNFIILLKEAL